VSDCPYDVSTDTNQLDTWMLGSMYDVRGDRDRGCTSLPAPSRLFLASRSCHSA
jgi:hypothetical protein